tara:strand:+ start:152 stop:562 length:411 start_codon:yes stop_codon:yes gene_type:complete
MKYFRIEEYVDKATYKRYGEKSVWFIDPRLVVLMDTLRELFDSPILINNWLWGGVYQYRGLRPSGTPWYTKFSQHSFGRAVDFDVEGFTSEEARLKIIEWHREGLLGDLDITLEGEVSWVHLDVRSHGEGLLIFYP